MAVPRGRNGPEPARREYLASDRADCRPAGQDVDLAPHRQHPKELRLDGKRRRSAYSYSHVHTDRRASAYAYTHPHDYADVYSNAHGRSRHAHDDAPTELLVLGLSIPPRLYRPLWPLLRLSR